MFFFILFFIWTHNPTLYLNFYFLLLFISVFFFFTTVILYLQVNYITLIFNLPTQKLFITLPSVFVYYFWPFIFIFILITWLTLVYCFTYNKTELVSFFFFTSIIFLVGGGLFFVNSLLIFFLLYETFLLPSFFILYNFAKTRKAVEAAFLMFFWTQFGATILIFNFQYLFFITESFFFYNLWFINFSFFEIQFLFITLLFGFGVKFPIWPFYGWLPKAHVEASTNFSIFLSGVLVKFAFFGFVKYLLNIGLDITPLWVYPFLLIGFLDASLKVYYQTDLKKLIAYATVIEMHWLTLAIICGSSFFWLAGFAMMISHACISSSFFLLIDSVTRRFKTRLITEISGLFFLIPNLYFVILTTLIIFLGFPGSLLFISEFMFFTALLDFNFVIFLLILFFAYFFVPSCFFKTWFLLLFGSNQNLLNKTCLVDLDKLESVLLWSFIIILFWFGFTFQFFF